MDAGIQPKSGVCRFLDGWLLAACHASRGRSHCDRSPERTVWGVAAVGRRSAFRAGRTGRTSVHHLRSQSPFSASWNLSLLDKKLKRRQLPPQCAPKITCKSRPELGSVYGVSIAIKSTYAVKSAAAAAWGDHFNHI